MALDARDIPDTKVDVSFASRKKPKTKPAADVKHTYDALDDKSKRESDTAHPLDRPKSLLDSESSNDGAQLVGATVTAKVPDSQTRRKNPSVSKVAPKETSDTTKRSPHAIMLHVVLAKLGPERAIRYLMFRELANASGHIQISQTELSAYLSIKSPTALRTLFTELCEKGLISILQEFDAGSRVARTYQLLPVVGDDGQVVG